MTISLCLRFCAIFKETKSILLPNSSDVLIRVDHEISVIDTDRQNKERSDSQNWAESEAEEKHSSQRGSTCHERTHARHYR